MPPNPLKPAADFFNARAHSQSSKPSANFPRDARAALKEGRIFSVPSFSGSFAWQGTTYPYTIVGGKPQAGGTTEVPVQLIPISLLFEEYADESGSPLILGPGQVIPRVLSSPNFSDAQYPNGVTQFADAVQRAQFNAVAAKDWHTVLGKPEVLKPLTIDVPRGLAKVYRNRITGVTYAIVDTNFFVSHLNTILQLENLRPDTLAIALTSNVFLAPQSDIKKCCVLGFHTSLDMGELAQVKFVQTFIWASWVDQGILGNKPG